MTALITAIAVLDILDVLRVVPVLVKALFLEEIFRHVFCSLGVFHELAVAIFLVSLSIAICFQVELSSCIADYIFRQHKTTHTYESRILKRRSFICTTIQTPLPARLPGEYDKSYSGVFLYSFQAGKESKYYQTGQMSIVHKIMIPLVLLVAAGAAAPFFLLPYDKLSYTCTDPFMVMDVTKTDSEKFTINLYSTFVTVFTYVLPVRW